MIKFGPSGNSDSFYEEGFKHSYQAMKWIAQKGLTAYEYSFGRGIKISQDSAKRIREEAEHYGITISVHAPYYVNLATNDAEKLEKNIAYFTETARAAEWLGSTRIIFHPGSCNKLDRKEAFSNILKNIELIFPLIPTSISLCPETMGKINQITNLEEEIELCRVFPTLIPTIDFGHLHSRGLGSLNTQEDFSAVLNALEKGIGSERTSLMHIHFSKQQFTQGGEKRHVTFADTKFGPDFENLAPLLFERDMHPTIICESKGTMAEDAVTMLNMYNKCSRKENSHNESN